MRQKTKSIKIKQVDYETLEELKLQALKERGIYKNKLELFHEIIQASKAESFKS